MSEELMISPAAPAAPAAGSALTSAQFRKLAEVPPEIEWFANIDSLQTRRAYQNDLRGFMAFAGIVSPEDFRLITRSHVLAWRKRLEEEQLGGATIRRKLAALSSLFEYLCEANAVTHNPVKGVKRPPVESWQGKTPALGDVQARALLEAPNAKTLKGKRDRAILSALLYHGIRREELARLKVKDYNQSRRGVPHLRIKGKGGKMRFIPTHPGTLTLIEEYLEAAGHGHDPDAPLFRPVKNNVHGHTLTALTPDSIYFEVVLKYLRKLGIFGENMGPHVMRATAATNALDNGADIAKVQEWLGHANIATTRIYDHRKTRPEDSPTFKVSY
ncbi:Site-specific recombinase XerD [Nitrosospira multiformis ATCC 25196]|uniref:Phage integrase n=1 Tax=Nitrosospira multiformis (strain ATCC 25196 / NCIMB 11849 / C 71) TaxID=323848 RepID=Q2Y7G4_NITMU|nr:tyrosine-type recombinase/integrase [Nitrosospira multiformis]ABB75307.1 Phage integrase [Nitrosospira multiformis ATCC 25196]SEG20494.1 Site-specific recombinase XerD [Nitrosospira multiformis ATCC 25196]